MIDTYSERDLKLSKFDILIDSHQKHICSIEDALLNNVTTLPFSNEVAMMSERSLKAIDQLRVVRDGLKILKAEYEDTTEG